MNCPTNFSLSSRNDKLKETLIKYREAVATSSPTLPLGATLGYRRKKEDATPSGVEANWNSIPKVAATETLGWWLQPLRGT
jgi:hypothetical protein